MIATAAAFLASGDPGDKKGIGRQIGINLKKRKSRKTEIT